MSSEERVVWSLDNGVALVALNRPDKRNALDGAMFGAIAAVGDEVAAAPGVRAVVLTGRGPSFCAGLDLAAFGGGASGPDPMEVQPDGVLHLAQKCAWVWQEVQVPVIAALSGHALGAGLQIALGADIRIAHPDTKLGLKEVDFGIAPDMTGTFTLSRLARPDVAMLLAATGMTITAADAVELGLVTRLRADPLADALELAGQMAAKSPDAVRAVKRLVRATDQRDSGAHFVAERETVLALAGSPNQLEAVSAAVERRAPVFGDT